MKKSFLGLILLTTNIIAKDIPKYELVINQPTNWYLILLPIITIVVVITGFILTKKQLEEKSKESINTFNKMIEKQTELSKNQIKLETLSKNRQKWINDLREEIAIFLSTAYTIEDHGELEEKDINTDEFLKYSNQLFKTKYKIALLINPKESSHNDLINILDEITSSLGNIDNNSIIKLIKISQIILKKEWERVKELK